MGMELEYTPAPQKPRLRKRMLNVFVRRIRETYRYDTDLWRSALSGLWTVCFLAFSVAVMGIPTGLGTAADLMLAAGAGTVVLALAGNVLALLLSLIGLPVPRLFAGSLLGVAGVILLILYYADVDLTAAAYVALLAALLGGFGGLAVGLIRRRRVISGLLLAAAVLLTPPVIVYTVDTGITPLEAKVHDRSGPPLEAVNPGRPGNYSYHSFTYGSGMDLHRIEYGQDATLLSTTADASAYIKTWPKLRTLFWGFDQSALPLNARVWMPDGEGPFPVILMVHGNHMMEDYSDGGYAYLGEQLASRGFIALSLDENFLNYSAWSGIPDNDFKVRSWMILKHLEQLSAFSEQTGNPFFHKIDYTKTALLGHSRGGQAVAMTADADRWFKSDPVLIGAGKFHITSVIALAPTDKTVDNKQARLQDVSYLTLQGARDGDVHDFYGDRQYIRSSYSRNSPAFKSSLYIADANHSQFNTGWGHYDQSLPVGLFLSRKHIMDGEAQRQIAKVYVSAFLETTLHGKQEYMDLFRDYRSGLAWLPDTAYYNRYQNGGYIPAATFDEDRNKNTALGGTVESAGLSWTEEVAKDREAKSKATYGVLLERSSAGAERSFYRINLKNTLSAEARGTEGLTFSMANRNADKSLQKGSAITSSPTPNVEVELTDSYNNSARLPLSDVMDILPLPQTRFTLSPWLEERISDGKYGDLSEAVFQTYELSFQRFVEKEPALDPAHLTGITFYLQAAGDRIMLDDIGFYKLHEGNEATL